MIHWKNITEDCLKILNSSKKEDALQLLCDYLKKRVSHYEWVGIYTMNPNTQRLSLLCFSGLPTEHTEIEYGKGICGQVAHSGEALFVADVGKESNYISCNHNVKSEVVFPIYHGEELVAQVDIDSNDLDPFDENDSLMLSEVCGEIGKNWAALNS